MEQIENMHKWPDAKLAKELVFAEKSVVPGWTETEEWLARLQAEAERRRQVENSRASEEVAVP